MASTITQTENSQPVAPRPYWDSEISGGNGSSLTHWTTTHSGQPTTAQPRPAIRHPFTLPSSARGSAVSGAERPASGADDDRAIAAG